MNYLPKSKATKFRDENKPTHCPITGRKDPLNGWHIDHDHETGRVRGVISGEANLLIGKIENTAKRFCKCDNPIELSEWLLVISDYLSKDRYSKPLHWHGAKQLASKFARQPAADQKSELTCLGIEPAKNAKERKAQYLKYLKTQ